MPEQVEHQSIGQGIRTLAEQLEHACDQRDALLDALREIVTYTAPLMQAKDPLGFDIDRIARAAINAVERGAN